MSLAIDFDNHIKVFNESMRGMQRILLVGTNYDMSKYPALAHKKWKCIYSTNRSDKIADIFSEPDRQVRPIYFLEEYNAAETKLDQNNPLLIYLNDSEDYSEDIDVDAEEDREQNIKGLRETLGTLLKSDVLVELVVVGYNPEDPREISSKDFYSLVRTLSDNRITFYGLSAKYHDDRYISALVGKGIAKVFTRDLGEALEKAKKVEESEDDFFDCDFDTDSQKNTVYIDHKPVTLNSNLCYDFGKYGRVLTIQEMNTGTISRMMQLDYFYQFLKRSPNEPQWYGYAPRNAFAIKRDFEQTLYSKVVIGLSESSEKPIILLGQTSSGKSIALAGLAYRMFQEHKYPVLFINNPDISFTPGTPAATALDNILKEIRDKGGKALVILDWSVYNLQRSNIVRKIATHYNNRGHKVLFVASALYSDKVGDRFYEFINSPIALSEVEKQQFKNLIIEKGKLPKEKVEKWLEINGNESGLLSMLYRLVYELHPQLEQGVKHEITQALQDTRDSIYELGDPVPLKRQLNSIALQLIKLGLVSIEDTSPDNDKKEQIVNNLQPFSEALAVATLFKLRMPMTMAMHLLNIPECENKQSYRDVVFNAPWLYYAMDDDKYAPGAYYVSFRDPMDARIYLRSINKSEIDKMHIVANIIAAVVNKKDAFFNDEIRFLEHLIRLVGPNSEDLSVRNEWYSTYGAGSVHIIESLAKLREAGIVEPLLVAQEITYIREFYGSDKNPNYTERIEWLKKAIIIARELLDMTTHPNVDTAYWQQNLIDSITVESIFSELQLERCYKEQPLIASKQNAILSTYKQRRDMLTNIIYDQPENSYAYTALLSCFMEEYANATDSIEMVKDTAKIMEIIDITATSVTSVEENEYYQKKKADFLMIFDRISGSDRAERYFGELIEMGSGVGVYLKASAILRRSGIKYSAPISNQAKLICKEVLDILEKEEYVSIIKYHAACQYMRLQLSWLCYNGNPLFAEERQLTAITDEQWEKLYQICDEFKNNIINRNKECSCKAVIYYVMALAAAQLNQFDRAVDIWREVQEDDFYDLGRQYTWHILCTSEGNPKIFNGTFNVRRPLQERRIHIKEMNRAVIYPSLQSIGKSDTSGDAPGLCIGTSYRGFSAFSKDWKKRREH